MCAGVLRKFVSFGVSHQASLPTINQFKCAPK
jgi:hypothetical protein